MANRGGGRPERPPLPPLPPLHRLPTVPAPAPEPTDVNIVNFLDARAWQQLDLSDSQQPVFEGAEHNDEHPLVHGEPSPWSKPSEGYDLHLFPPLEPADYGMRDADVDEVVTPNEGRALENTVRERNPLFFELLSTAAKEHFDGLPLDGAVHTSSYWRVHSSHLLYVQIPALTSNPKLLEVFVSHHVGEQTRAAGPPDLLQFAASFRDLFNWDADEQEMYGTGSPADMIDVQEPALWDRQVRTGRIRNVRLVPLGDERLRAADGNDNGGDVEMTDDANGDTWVDMIGLWYKGQVRRPFSRVLRDVAFPMTVKPPSGARRTLGFVRIGVQVVHDRKFEGGAGYADTQYFMKFPVPHDWSVEDGWTPMQYSWLRERLAEFPVFDLEELKGHLAEVDLRTVDAGASRSFAAAAAAAAAAQEADAPSGKRPRTEGAEGG